MFSDPPSAALLPPDPLPLLAFSSGPPLSLRVIVGALRACGAFLTSTGCEPNGSSSIEFEYPSSATVDLYSLLVALGLELDPASHLRLTVLCQCARRAPAGTHVFHLRIVPEIPIEQGEPSAWNWLRSNRCASVS
jgi:hypothetical protein